MTLRFARYKGRIISCVSTQNLRYPFEMTSSLQNHSVRTHGVTLHVVSAGPEAGPLLIFLHGFPEAWFGWRKQIEHFAALGYRVLAPDQRGYNLSEKSAKIADYRLDRLAGDIVGLIDWAGRPKALIVGHDWGAAVAWWLAAKHPERLEKLVILNVPHPAVMQRNLYTNLRQLMRSWYMFFFQLPALPEWALSRGVAQGLRRELEGTGAFDREELAEYQLAWLQPGAIRGMVNWYRAALQRPVRVGGSASRITVPTLILWGVKDKYLGREMATQSLGHCDDARLEWLEDATHWLHHERAELVNRLIGDFIRPSLGIIRDDSSLLT